MRRLFARPDSPGRFRASVEELEDRAQPALLTFAVGVPAMVSFETQVSFFVVHGNAGVTLPPQANEHAQIVIALHMGNTGTPTTPPTIPTNPPATDPTPSATQPPANASGSAPAPTSTGGASGITSAGFALLASVASAIPPAAARAASNPAASTPATVSSLLLPPNATAVAEDATALPILAREAPTELIDAQAGIPVFPAPAPILYLRELSAPGRPELFGNTNRLAVYDAANPMPNIATLPAAMAPDQPREVAEGVLSLPQLFPVVAEPEPATPAVAPPASTETPEEGTSPWAWAAAVAGVVAGASWLLHRHLRKPTAAAQPVRDWRDYPLGLDVDRL